MSSIPFFLSLLPFAVFLYLLLFRKTPLLTSAGITCATVFLLVFFFWKIIPIYILIAFLKGILIALDIFIIIIGAIFFLRILEKLGIIQSLSLHLESFSKDYRIQTILLAWFFENFLEGTAGFGTASAIVAPLLIGIGINPLHAVIISLLGNSASVVFGAAGAPIRIGFAELASATTPLYASLFNIVGCIVPLFILWTVTAGQRDRKNHFWEVVPFAIWSGLAFAIPSVFVAYVFGQELPSILGAVIGFACVVASTKFGLFVPKTIRTLHASQDQSPKMPLFKVGMPYVFLILFLITGKILLGSASISFALPQGIVHAMSIFNPGFAFILTGCIVLLLYKKMKRTFLPGIRIAITKAFDPFLIIAFMSFITQMMIFSGKNTSFLPASIALVAQTFENAFLPIWAPLIGAFGSFLTGSATVSNIMFGNSLAVAAKAMVMNTDIILALAVVGAAAGNMIALADIVATETVVGLKNKEPAVLKGVIIPCLIYILLIGCIGMIASRI